MPGPQLTGQAGAWGRGERGERAKGQCKIYALLIDVKIVLRFVRVCYAITLFPGRALMKSPS